MHHPYIGPSLRSEAVEIMFFLLKNISLCMYHNRKALILRPKDKCYRMEQISIKMKT